MDILHLSHTCMFIDISDSMVEFSIEIILFQNFIIIQITKSSRALKHLFIFIPTAKVFRGTYSAE